MEIRIVTKPAFTVIGKEGRGPAGNGAGWIAPLWAEANAQFAEIEPLAKRTESGQFAGFWGAMSSVDRTFHPWEDEGLYLAGCEAKDDAQAPQGWTRWRVPGYEFATVRCNQSTYGKAFALVLEEYFPQNGLSLAGAVHEFYTAEDLGSTDGSLTLCFPYRRL